jgi:hypothetical protein
LLEAGAPSASWVTSPQLWASTPASGAPREGTRAASAPRPAPLVPWDASTAPWRSLARRAALRAQLGTTPMWRVPPYASSAPPGDLKATGARAPALGAPQAHTAAQLVWRRAWRASKVATSRTAAPPSASGVLRENTTRTLARRLPARVSRAHMDRSRRCQAPASASCAPQDNSRRARARWRAMRAPLAGTCRRQAAARARTAYLVAGRRLARSASARSARRTRTARCPPQRAPTRARRVQRTAGRPGRRAVTRAPAAGNRAGGRLPHPPACTSRRCTSACLCSA